MSTLEHVLYKDGDPDVPRCILDQPYGQVALALCRVCHQSEAELADECPGPPQPQSERLDANGVPESPLIGGTPAQWPEAKSVLVLVDFSAIAYACWHAAERAHEADPKYDPHEVIKTNLRMKMATIEEFTGEEPNKYVMVLDDHPQWRYNLFPGYKGDRDRTKHNPRPEAEAYLREAYPGAQWVKGPGFEADDVIATLVKANRGQRAVVVVSGDADLFQLFGPGVKIFNSITKRFLDLSSVAKKFYGLEPKHVRLCKAFFGDTSDSLPNCCPRQQRQLIPIILESGGDLLKMTDLQKKVSEKCWEYLRANAKQILVNWKLAELNSDVPLEWK